MKRYSLFLFFLLIVNISVFSQNNGNMISIDFRNQKISDIIFSVADMCGKSVSIDETVTGNTSFHFEDTDFDTAVNEFCNYAHVFVYKENNIYNFTKVKIEEKGNTYTIDCENVSIEAFIKKFTRICNVTIMYDSLPNTDVSIKVKEASIDEVMELVMLRLSSYNLEKVSKGFYISKTVRSQNSNKNSEDFSIKKTDESYSLILKKATLNSVLDNLFSNARKEYSYLSKNSIVLENLNYESKDFDVLLRLILEQATCDFTITNGIYYIFEVQKKDILKNLKQTTQIKLQHISIDMLQNLFPAEYNIQSFIKFDKSRNNVFVTGSYEETKAIIDFIESVDIPVEDKYYSKFTLKNITSKEAIELIPTGMLYSNIITLKDDFSFITLVSSEKEEELHNYLNIIDRKTDSYPIRLKFIKSDELLQNLPPSVKKDNIVISNDNSLFFYKGTAESYQVFLRDLELLDKPKQQIKYQILVIQQQKTKGKTSGGGLSVKRNKDNPSLDWNVSMVNLLDINFDVISQLGMQFASNLSAELSEGKAKVLADTTLNGISGEKITFSNTNIYRYRDVVLDNKGDVYSSTTREISSGLTLSISGWVSGDNMITVNVDAQISKQGNSDNTNDAKTSPPSTSEKKVSTNVRTKSGTPVIIGGLLQTETDSTVKKIPVLGSIPLVGNLFKTVVKSDANTELVIYLVPYVERTGNNVLDCEKNINRYIQKYLNF